ncbi:hypothetical protein DDB_G0269722 [Dictyostelium discoideum AX4]|uniref:Probable 18S rRNA (guanine-N(7))-methyltransferase n=1 Tax=Dictyostelium discoideum TaxID=44689 RepID=BUD23_DICDI|nr:hypothetical protein DDB_G0269722 [Dictyostelium discoideum AX4]Q55DA6.1 RecName: Full=Probable 18S rRNA (guanine-N(7))-methyltransferase; AltName: Full=Bud site selection protein 23 homolog; AltName: Full=Williams-Beuren syndrome chromosomal region 22 protein homolog [Dictyostelium discoideum]EAL72211.1 hypothetical protein DDB_G0269722 [Dictyostelium discoideum AX4]|eukprot:XP_646225.1 hypothetical protein DDB_G0269722 [Dictyostelium discoideum AX4]
MSRPEHIAPPEIFYDDVESKKYSSNSRIIEIQTKMAERAYELLAIPETAEGLMLLDIGCGSGISGDVITDAGHYWIGCDISQHMLDVAIDREVEGDVMLRDIGQGFPFRAGSFDAAISISAIQWLCNAEKSHHNPRKRLHTFFQSLFNVLTRGGKAILQFYPENSAQIEMITASALRCGFSGGLLIDFPNSSKAKKYFLVLFTGNNNIMPSAKGVEGEEYEQQEEEDSNEVKYSNRKRDRRRVTKSKGSAQHKTKEWIMNKKDRQRKQGREIKNDSKFSGRKRGPKF